MSSITSTDIWCSQCIAYSGVIPEPFLTHNPSRSRFRVYVKQKHMVRVTPAVKLSGLVTYLPSNSMNAVNGSLRKVMRRDGAAQICLLDSKLKLQRVSGDDTDAALPCKRKHILARGVCEQVASLKPMATAVDNRLSCTQRGFFDWLLSRKVSTLRSGIAPVLVVGCKPKYRNSRSVSEILNCAFVSCTVVLCPVMYQVWQRRPRAQAGV